MLKYNKICRGKDASYLHYKIGGEINCMREWRERKKERKRERERERERMYV